MFPRTVGFVNAFGQTETTSTLTVLGPDDHRLDGAPEEVERNLKRLVSIGRPLPDVQVKVVDDDGAELPAGEVGELWVRTPRTMKGYAGRDGGVTQSGARRLAADARHGLDRRRRLHLPRRAQGRHDHPRRREHLAGRGRGGALLACGVEEVAVVGLPDVEWGQRVAAVVVPRPGATLAQEELGEFCRQRLASFKKPEVFRFVDALPKNQMGKILKKDLRAQLAGQD